MVGRPQAAAPLVIFKRKETKAEETPPSLYLQYRSLHPVLITNNYNDWRSAKIDLSRGKQGIRRKHWPIFYTNNGFMIFYVYEYNPWAIGFGGIGADTEPNDYLEFDGKKWYTGGCAWTPTQEDKEAMDWESFTASDIDEWELEYGIGKYHNQKPALAG